MKQATACAVAVLIFLIGLTGCTKKLDWAEYSSDTGRFTALMPGDPKTEMQSIPTAVGSIDMYFFSVDQPNVSFAVAYADYPSEIISKVSASALLDAGRNGALANVKGKLERKVDVFFGTDPGQEFWFKANVRNMPGYGHAVVMLRGARLYQMLVVGLEATFPAEDAQKFLDSIDIWN